MSDAHTTLPTSRPQARLAGSRLYFTGNPCKHGHVGPRFTIDAHCVQCSRDEGKRYYSRNADEWKRRAQTDEQKQYQAEYFKKNKPRAYFYTSRIRAGRASPPWLTDEHRDQIVALFDQAERLSKETGVKHTVDHIVPLRGYTRTDKRQVVCGLHVPWNLQILTQQENNSKGEWYEG